MANDHGQLQIHIDHKPYPAPANPMTGRAIKDLVPLNPTDRLFLEVHGKGEDREIRDDESVTLIEGMQFYHLPSEIVAG